MEHDFSVVGCCEGEVWMVFFADIADQGFAERGGFFYDVVDFSNVFCENRLHCVFKEVEDHIVNFKKTFGCLFWYGCSRLVLVCGAFFVGLSLFAFSLAFFVSVLLV